jgi:light-independent protochlorophyllide reductase subunit B
MKLAYWMYAGPAHIGTLRVATSFRNVHAIMHAPLGDDYFNVMRSMLEREKEFTPVTASIVDRHVLARGSEEKVVQNITRQDKEQKPDLILLTPTCTSSILQEDLQNFAERASMESTCDVLLADVNHYRVNEYQAADRTLEQVVRFYTSKGHATEPLLLSETSQYKKTKNPSVNLIGFFTLGFHNSHDCKELTLLLNNLGVDVNLVLPESVNKDTRVHDLKKLPEAWLNILPYREVGLMTAQYLEKSFGMPFVSITPMGVGETQSFIREVMNLVSRTSKTLNCQLSWAESSASHPAPHPFSGDNENSWKSFLDNLPGSNAKWFARSIDCQNFTGKTACVFGDATHAVAMTKILVREMGIHVKCVGTYCKHDADWFREQIQSSIGGLADEILITESHTEVNAMLERCHPDAIFGTQMERHIGKRLGIPCGVISAPVHIQNFPLSYRPFLGIEGTNHIVDLIYNSFTLGMEDHLLEVFGGHDRAAEFNEMKSSGTASESDKPLENFDEFPWEGSALKALNQIPKFVRGKIKIKTEEFARKHALNQITLDIMYKAKEVGNSKTPA